MKSVFVIGPDESNRGTPGAEEIRHVQSVFQDVPFRLRDHWLKVMDTVIMDGPALRVWMRESIPPTSRYAERPGRWSRSRNGHRPVSTTADDVDTVRAETRRARSLRRGDWHIRTVTRTVMTSTEGEFPIAAKLDAREGDKRVFSRNRDE